MAILEKRYAEALLALAIEKNIQNEVSTDLLEIVELYTKCNEFKFFLNNPEIKDCDKKSTLIKILDKQINIYVLNLIQVIIDKNRIPAIPGILFEYKKLLEKHANIISLEIYSAEKLSIDEIKGIELKYQIKFNCKAVKSNVIIDKSLIGGIKVKIGDKIFDSSIQGRLNSLKDQLLAI